MSTLRQNLFGGCHFARRVTDGLKIDFMMLCIVTFGLKVMKFESLRCYLWTVQHGGTGVIEIELVVSLVQQSTTVVLGVTQ